MTQIDQINISSSSNRVLNRQPVNYREAKRRFTGLGIDDSATVDPAIPPSGKKYNFYQEAQRADFASDNNAKNQIYVISCTDNPTGSFTFDNEVEYNNLLNNKINPLLGKWIQSVIDPNGDGTSRIQQEWLDTTFAEINFGDDDEAAKKGKELKQDAIFKIYFDEKTKRYRAKVIKCR